THAITFFCASLLFCGYLLCHARLNRKYIRRMLRVGVAYALGLALTAWYVAPQVYLLKHLAGGLNFPVGKSDWLTPLGVLLAPTVMPPVPVPTIFIWSPMQFGLQVGWPILAAAGMALDALYARRPGGAAARGTVGRLLLLFFFTLFVVWTPFDFWKHLPNIFGFVQFSYRLLMFLVLWGALLAAFALKVYYPQGMRFEHAVVCVLVLGLFLSP